MSVFLLAMVSTAAGQTITVDDNGPADFSCVHYAIDDANDGTIIFVHGTCTGKEEEVRW